MVLKKCVCAALAALCLLGALCLPASAAPLIPTVNHYEPGQFSDVALDAWFTPSVAQAYSLGLLHGYPGGTFCPGASISLAETVTLACQLHRLSRGEDTDFPDTQPWYQTYVDYAGAQGMLLGEYGDYNAPVTRSQFAAILAHSLPEGSLGEINAVEDGQIPDVPMTAPAAAEIYSLYRAGVLVGNDDAHTFAPDTEIRRSEVAAIAVRLADPDRRVTFTWGSAPDHPTLSLQPAAEDGFFADAAMLGNSLVDGMMLCSGLKLDFYGGTSMTVYHNRLSELLQKQYGKVYIQLGINELGGSQEDFIAAYRKILQQIQTAMPEAQIYIMAITPVTQSRDSEGVFTMRRIGSFNQALYDLAEETGCWYLDTFTLLCDDSGYLPEQYGGWDGSPHLSNAGYQAWAEVVRTYYAA